MPWCVSQSTDPVAIRGQNFERNPSTSASNCSPLNERVPSFCRGGVKELLSGYVSDANAFCVQVIVLPSGKNPDLFFSVAADFRYRKLFQVKLRYPMLILWIWRFHLPKSLISHNPTQYGLRSAHIAISSRCRRDDRARHCIRYRVGRPMLTWARLLFVPRRRVGRGASRTGIGLAVITLPEGSERMIYPRSLSARRISG
jgi:hypothetical protein